MNSASIENPAILLFERSPYGSLDAIVQHDNRAVYLFLTDNDQRFGTRACWVRNLIEGPMVFSQSDLLVGLPPVMPEMYCRPGSPRDLPDVDTLNVVWFEEGNGIALFADQELLAAIPPWSGEGGFHGYSRDCSHENQVAWPLPDQPALLRRIERAREFWGDLKKLSADVATEIRDAYRQQFGEPRECVTVVHDHRVPVSILSVQQAGFQLLLTCGMSIRPQPNVEIASATPAGLRRIELGMVVKPDGLIQDANLAANILAHQAGYPWRQWTWFDQGHTCRVQMPQGSRWPQMDFQLLESISLRADDRELRVWGDPVRLLWLDPQGGSQSRT